MLHVPGASGHNTITQRVHKARNTVTQCYEGPKNPSNAVTRNTGPNMLNPKTMRSETVTNLKVFFMHPGSGKRYTDIHHTTTNFYCFESMTSDTVTTHTMSLAALVLLLLLVQLSRFAGLTLCGECIKTTRTCGSCSLCFGFKSGSCCCCGGLVSITIVI